ncbi:MAG: DUF2911 domain-containing protein [Vicinamibacteria bacterium]
MFRSFIAIVSFAIMALPPLVLAQNARGTAETSLSGKKVSVEYGRPGLKGRDVLSEAPVGTIWRTGADKSTTFTTEADLSVGGKTIPQGSYSLFTRRVDDKNWALIFNKQTGQWGTEHDAGQDLAQVPLTWEQKASGPDPFTIELSSAGAKGEMRMSWGKHVLALPLQVK